jgi:hypothetical protein
VEHVAADDDPGRVDAGVLGPDLEPEIAFGDDVVLDDDVPAAVDVDPGAEAAAVARARARDGVAVDDAVPCHLAEIRLDRRLAADQVDADVVDVVHGCSSPEVGDVAVQRERSLGAGSQSESRCRR